MKESTLSMKIARAKCMQCIPVVVGCLLLMLSSNVRGDLNDWEELPLHGGEIHHGIEIDPNDPSHMFCIVGTGEKEGGGGPSTLYESKNSAETWEKVQVIPPYNGYPDPFNIDFLRYAPSNETTIYAGRIRSFDNGATWETMPNVPGWVIGIDPENEQVLYAAQRGEMFTYVDLLFKSQNGGGTWTTLGLQLDNTNVRDFLINYDNPDVLIAAAWTIDKGLALKEGLYLSEDGGLNWTWIFWNWPFSVKQHITNPSMLFIGAAKEFYRASDYSEFWTMWDVVASMKRVKCVLTHPSLSNRVYAFTREGAYTSSDTGLSFTKKAAFPTRVVSGAVDDTGTSTILYTGCSHGVGVWCSQDEGETWIEKNKGIRDNEVWDIKEDPENSSTLYVATDKGIARLDVESDKDIQLLTDFDYSIGCLAFDSFDPSLIVTLLWPNRISRSTDKGLTWSGSTTFRNMIGTPLPLMADCVYASKETPQRFLVGTRNSFYDAERGIYKSLDGGQTFVTTPVLELAVTCMESGVYYDGYMCFAGVKDDDRGGVYKSMDDGETWIDTGLSNLAVSTLAVDPDNGNRVYVAGNIADTPAMYRTTDCGATWVECTPSFDLTGGIRDIELDPCHPKHLFVSVESAIYESGNEGKTWKVFSDGLENVRALYVVPGDREPLGSSGGHVSQEPPLSQDVFAGTNGGLFRCAKPQSPTSVNSKWTRYK